MPKHPKKIRTRDGEVIDVGALMHSMDHLRWDHPTVMKAFRVARELQVWLDKQYADPEKTPHVAVVISTAIVSLIIGDSCVWENQSCNEDELTADHCRQQMHEEALILMTPFE